MTDTGSAGLIAAEVGIDVVEEDRGSWPLTLSRYSFVASLEADPEKIQGFGCGASAEEARRRAIAECLERYAQFGCTPRHVRVATGVSLGDAAISPESLGLYSDDQYETPDFPFVRYSGREPLEWVEVVDLKTNRPRYLPVDFVYPYAVIGRKRLVGETSSGTAAHSSQPAGLVAAVCELIERDSLMMFWHRRPPTCLLSMNTEVSDRAAEDLESIRAMGFVVVVCVLEYDLGIPCVLAVGLRGDRFAYGAGCHPCVNEALEHALRELGSLLRWQVLKSGQPRYWISLADVRKPSDHYALYDGGPFHGLLRQTLENTIYLAEGRMYQSRTPCVTDEHALDVVLGCLEERGYRVYGFDLTPNDLRQKSLMVTRIFVPGLIPMYFGVNNIRLGCRRLWSREGPGRLCSLLPHFMT